MAAERVTLNLKLAPGVGKKTLDKLLAQTPGVQSVIQTFPDETDEELSRLYVLEVKASESEAAINSLNKYLEVEYVESAAPRGLKGKSN
ncbi:MAG: hypothetical protein JST85_27665 [Acidobacteria bacterium]|nr:hypothetical protein [Acidobacteriota bacterium]